jgi:hypothetical protein
LEFSAWPAQAGIARKSQAATTSAESAQFLLRAQLSLHPLVTPRRFMSSLEPLSKKRTTSLARALPHTIPGEGRLGA